MIAQDVRILDSRSKIVNKGRLEIRMNGEWGTVCAIGLSKKTANVVCRELGYLQGKFLNPKPEIGVNFCSKIDGLDYCGESSEKILFSNLDCHGNEKSIKECSRVADTSKCSHALDAIIECENEPRKKKLPFGSIRLIDSSGNPTKTGVGRLEVYKNEFGTVCDTGFNEKAAQVACKQMGYFNGRVYRPTENSSICENVLGDNLCGNPNQKILATEVKCTGYEKSIHQCRYSKQTGSCSILNNVILSCDGDGDSSGQSQRKISGDVNKPIVEYLNFPTIKNLKCEDTAHNMYFRGNPGSIFLINCPSGCIDSTAHVVGTGIYSLTSSICKAGIQSGAFNNDGGSAILVKTYGQNNYYGSNIRNINSSDSSHLIASFFVSRTNYIYTNLSIFSEDSLLSFLEVNNKFRLGGITKKNKKILKENEQFANKLSYFSSFLDINQSINQFVDNFNAVFDWMPSSYENEFKDKRFINLFEFDIESRKILNFNIFSIILNFKLFKNSNKKQVLFSLGGCGGYSIIINEDTELIFEYGCASKTFYSGIFIPYKSYTMMIIVFDGFQIEFYNGNRKSITIKTSMEFNPKPEIMIGKYSAFDAYYLNGEIKYFGFFQDAFSTRSIENLLDLGIFENFRRKIDNQITVDERKCITSCAIQTIPGMPNSPESPKESNEGKLKYLDSYCQW